MNVDRTSRGYRLGHAAGYNTGRAAQYLWARRLFIACSATLVLWLDWFVPSVPLRFLICFAFGAAWGAVSLRLRARRPNQPNQRSNP